MKNKIKIELMQNNNDDLTVVNTARVSFGKQRKSVNKQDEALIDFLVRESHVAPLCHSNFLFKFHMSNLDFIKLINTNLLEYYAFKMSIIKFNGGIVSFYLRGSLWGFANILIDERVENSLRYYTPVSYRSLEKHDLLGREFIKNTKPEEHCYIYRKSINEQIEHLRRDIPNNPHNLYKLIPVSFRITAPLYTARQWFKTQVGVVRSEESRRYISTPPSLFKVEYREKPDGSIKQGSNKNIVELPPFTFNDMELTDDDFNKLLLDRYEFLLENNVAPEVARGDLPQKMNVTWVETMSLLEVSRLISLRSEKHAQNEAQILAGGLINIMSFVMGKDNYNEMVNLYEKGKLNFKKVK